MRSELNRIKDNGSFRDSRKMRLQFSRLYSNVIALLITIFLLLLPSQTQASRYKVPIVANPLGLYEGYELYIDARNMVAPKDIGTVTLSILCNSTEGTQYVIEDVIDTALARGELYYLVQQWPRNCDMWVGVIRAKILPIHGKADDEGVAHLAVDADIQQGQITGELNYQSPLPKQIELLHPADWARFNHSPKNLTLQWMPTLGAHAYKVEIEYWYEKWLLLQTDTVRSSSFAFIFVGAQPGRWRVRAVTIDGQEGPPSDWRHFDFSP